METKCCCGCDTFYLIKSYNEYGKFTEQGSFDIIEIEETNLVYLKEEDQYICDNCNRIYQLVWDRNVRKNETCYRLEMVSDKNAKDLKEEEEDDEETLNLQFV